MRCQLPKVLLVAGGVHQHRPGVDRSGRHNLRTGSAGKSQRQPALILAGVLLDAGQLAQLLEEVRRRGFGHEHEDQILDHLGAAPNIAGNYGASNPRQALQCRSQALGLISRMMEQPVGAGLTKVGDALEDVLRGPGAESGQLGQAAVLGRRLQVRERIDPQDIVYLPDLGNAQARDLQHLDQARGNLFAQLFQHPGLARADQFGDDLECGRTDSLGEGQGAVLQRLPEIAGEAHQRTRRGPEGADPEWVLALQFEEGGDLLQHLRHRLLVHVVLYTFHSS